MKSSGRISAVVFLILSIAYSLQAAEEPPFLLIQCGTQGTGACQFHRPNGIAVDPSGTIYVADTGNSYNFV